MKTSALISTALMALLLGLQPEATAGTTVNVGTISEITGPADLDLTGNIVYAVNLDGNDETVNGVTFVADVTPPAGFTSVGPQNVPGGWQTKPEFGDTPDDDALENIYKDIRWTNAAADPPLQANMDVTPGVQYRLQVLFYGNHAADRRGWDIQVDGVEAVDNITSLGVDAGAGVPAYSPNIGLVFRYDFTAPDNQVNVIMGQLFGLPPEQGDRNAIWQGITLEQLAPATDVDGDTLPDSWEYQHFGAGNLSETAGGDPDGDGLTNLQELNASTKPNDADTDDDGLNDGAEINTHLTNPRSADTDGDGLNDGAELNTHSTNPSDADTDNDSLSDGAEVNTHLTNPKNIDSDSDGYNDPTEVFNGSNPVAAAGVPPNGYIACVLGPDAGEGLDLTGSFLYAFNVGTPGAAGWAHDANFTADNEPGITVSAQNEIPNWAAPQFGVSADDDVLEFVYQSIRWVEAGQLLVDLDNLVVGRRYKLQLLFGETCCADRYYDIVVEGTLVVDEFNTMLPQGGIPMRYAGSAFVYEFVAGDTQLNIVLDGPGSTTGPHHNPILNGATLEELTAQVPLEFSSISRTATSLTINFRGTPGKPYSVDFTSNLVTWGEVLDSLVPNGAGNASWTDTAPARVGGGRGFYKVRDPVLDPTP